eukprot:TRINITY_DN2688_c0_g1_i1.p1 TRINITY_DN2688_c0_g1~~TRINITY_DN2688_c0_g1_i1.p1  ORF type:complete len:587 (-),score=85.99 TRINITY_DN2688_c0_g1_i1:59-1756(-)
MVAAKPTSGEARSRLLSLLGFRSVAWFCVNIMTTFATASPPEIAGGEDNESALVCLLRVASLTSFVTLISLLLFLRRSGESSTEHETNTDSSLTWREDRGISKLAPLVPELKSKQPLERFTMAEVANHCSRDDLWIIVDERVYDITSFVSKHPGGDLPLVNMAGKDCTDVFANYHEARVYKHMLPPFMRGEVTDCKVPPHVADFREVRQELLRRGLFETDWRFYLKMGVFLVFLFCTSLWFTLGSVSTVGRMMGAVVMGIFFQQSAGVGHDLGHSGVTHRFHLDHQIGSVIACVSGLSTSWWKRNHNTHHIVCNSVEHDPDIQHMPIFAVTTKIFEKPFWSTYYTKQVCLDLAARTIVSFQHILYVPVMMVARFNLYVLSIVHLCSDKQKHHPYIEAGGFIFFFSWLIAVTLSMPTWGEALGWLLTSHAVSGILHVQITISHFSRDTYHGHAYNDADDEWYTMQLKTTMNVATPPCLDWIHIGLQFQIEHHILPRLPRHNLRIARDLVKEVCKKHNIHYHESGFFACVGETLSCLYNVAKATSATKKGASGFYESALWNGVVLNG